MEQKDRIREVRYRDLGGCNTFGFVAEATGHINVTMWETGKEVCCFDLSDADLVKLKAGVEDAMKQRGVPVRVRSWDYGDGYESGYQEGRLFGQSEGYNDGYKCGFAKGHDAAFVEVQAAIEKVGL